MRKRFELQPGLNSLPIEKIQFPLKSRDELPPILAGLQWIFSNPDLHSKVFELLEKKILSNKKATGRNGMHLWHILVLGVVRLGLNADFDRLEHYANFDSLVRQMLGVAETTWGEEAKVFDRRTIRNNVALVDEELLKEINKLVAKSGRSVFKKKESDPDQPLEIKVDTYVLESNVHFPTDLNLLWDGGRKCLDLIDKWRQEYELEGWRKINDWRRRIKSLERQSSKIVFGGGAEKEKRVKQIVKKYLQNARDLSGKVGQTIESLKNLPILLDQVEVIDYFHRMLDKHIDLVDRRLLQAEKIPSQEKVFSLFEPHTEWINKGKQRPPIELGHRLLVATDQDQLVQDYDIPLRECDVDQSIPVADRIIKEYGEGFIASISYDKGFSSKANRQDLEKKIAQVIMPKKGRKNKEESEAESTPEFKKLRNRHSAIESAINSLEHHGLNRCLDKGLEGFKRYVGYGVLAYNLHQIGRELIKRERANEEPIDKAA